ncbi:2Fe-2S iron-sulfur cluster-binding protein [Psychromarinibacter halotolerans]|uniref:2Fe-2S iron-sulfur cluster-binding protein n=1 Tax=Psychromarinibacter halotolerans TaxID=1775175 RepID=A0ABV7GHZ9_9RHOB|nr:2Fe-2S iron-sulfur cluster-binding protein [Psychromarinibacter halotolerans]MDF0599041.1 2Fe-2S iron-sulfur cluster-binding protein [Psychromarinibacter halotolerans]
MVKIIYVEPGGNERAVDVAEGYSVMEGAVSNGVKGIVAECGGACSCATCHAYLDEAWLDLVGPAEGDEADMLEFAHEPRANSRLTCQIEVTEALDGLRVTIPDAQA